MLDKDEVSAFYSQVAKTESLCANASLAEESLPYQLSYHLVSSAARFAHQSLNGLGDNDESEIDPDREGAFVIEEILFCLHMLDRLAFQDLPLQVRRGFMDELVQGVVEILWRSFAPEIELHLFVEYFTTIYNARQEEYWAYRPLELERNASQKNTLLWEYGKRMSALISSRKSATRVVRIGNIAMEYVSELVPLVRGVAGDVASKQES